MILHLTKDRSYLDPDLFRLGAEGSLKDIGDKKLTLRSKFTKITQAKLFWCFSSSTWRAMKIEDLLDKKGCTLTLYKFRDDVWCF